MIAPEDDSLGPHIDRVETENADLRNQLTKSLDALALVLEHQNRPIAVNTLNEIPRYKTRFELVRTVGQLAQIAVTTLVALRVFGLL